MLIVVSRDQSGLYESLKKRQEAKGRDRVFLDQRIAERRHAAGHGPTPDRRRADRRTPISDAERALLLVLGFMVVQRDLKRVAARAPRKRANRATGLPRAATRPKSGRRRVG